MAETDYKVVYKSRVTPRESDRPEQDRRSRAPRDTNPYNYPDEVISRTRSAREYDSSSTIDSASTVTAARTIKTTYPVKERSKEVYVDVEKSKRDRPDRSSRTTAEDRIRVDRRTVVSDQESSATRSPRGSGSIRNEPQRGNRGRVDQTRELQGAYMIDDSVRREDGAYVFDTRGELEIVMPGRDESRKSGERGPRYAYTNAPPRQRQQYYDERQSREDETLPGGVVILRRDVTPPGQSRPQHQREERPRARQYEEDDDWRIVESMRDTRMNSGKPRESRAQSRAPTQSSEDSFVLVSPEEPQSQPALRSALRQREYEPPELRRRRSRSISFREKELAYHDASESRHERPGAEAAICGQYLKKQSEQEVDVYDRRRMSEAPPRQERQRDQPQGRYEEYYRDERYTPYPPQQAQASKNRSRSRRRRQAEEDDDDRSYYSEHKFYKKETKYL